MSEMDRAVAVMEEFQTRLDQALAAGPARYAEVFANPPAGVGMHEIDKDRVIRRVNPVEPGLLGYPSTDLDGKPVSELIVMSEASRRAIDKKIAGEVALKPFARSFKRADGVAVTMAMVDRPIKDPSGAVVGLRTAMMIISG